MALVPVRDYTLYAKQARAQQARRLSALRLIERRERAWRTANAIAAFLRQNYPPVRILVFGSSLHPEVFHAQSDIDLAVEGLPWAAYLRAWNEVERNFGEFKVDLIDLGMRQGGWFPSPPLL
jgi:predicted nucleotidyltransferase